MLGIAYLHKSEMENDVYRHPGDRCIFPPRPGMRYQKTGDSQKAIEYFLKYLERKPDALDVRWLLNLAYMTLGGYPGQVPPKYLIPPSAFESTESVGRFVDVAPPKQGSIPSASRPASSWMISTTTDLLDVMLSDYDQCGAMHFFHNNGDGTFTDRTKEAGLVDPVGRLQHDSGRLQQRRMPRRSGAARGLGVSAEEISAAEQLRRHIYRRDRARAAWPNRRPARKRRRGLTSTTTDFVDLIVGNENGALQLFHNKGDGTFEDIAARGRRRPRRFRQSRGRR